MPAFGIISGSGLYDIPGLEIGQSVDIATPFGPPSCKYTMGSISGLEVFFLPRHGSVHNIQPHRINYRANIWGFKELGVEKILSLGASGGINPAIKPGMILIPDQIIDTTSGRPSTFFEGSEVMHVDFTEPFCPDMRSRIFSAAEKAGVDVVKKGVYICVNGPRLETSAEIRAFATWGADIVGMTAMPEAVLAREAGLCFAGISVITNFAAGLTRHKLTSTEVVRTMGESAQSLRRLLEFFFSLDFITSGCGCKEALDGAGM